MAPASPFHQNQPQIDQFPEQFHQSLPQVGPVQFQHTQHTQQQVDQFPQAQFHQNLPQVDFAAQFQQNLPKANGFDQFFYTQSQCSHGPNLANVRQTAFPSGLPPSAGLIPQLQTVYGVPNQALDVSQTSGFEQAQNAQQGLLTSYGPPASGSVTSIESLLRTHEVNAPASSSYESLLRSHEVNGPSSSYGPPPSGDPNDSYAHGSHKSLSTIHVQELNETQSASETSYRQLPGLDGAGLDIISAQKSHTVEIPVQGQLGTYALQFQSADPLASQNNELGTPDHQRLLSEGLLQSILSAIEHPKSDNHLDASQTIDESLDNHPDVKEFVVSEQGKDTLAEVKAE